MANGCPRMPLAVYREVVTHLRQVKGVYAGEIGQQSRDFDYSDSQVGGLLIEYAPQADRNSRVRVEEILAYYSDRYGAWEVRPAE
ncbi:MAG: hypothetical protein GDA38_23360 [Hormoscilla sp. SP12CHS1]|nr:hypothetical protein [Hormoscilla sp. SP12CHS1]